VKKLLKTGQKATKNRAKKYQKMRHKNRQKTVKKWTKLAKNRVRSRPKRPLKNILINAKKVAE
jgi:hypothetical protein